MAFYDDEFKNCENDEQYEMTPEEIQETLDLIEDFNGVFFEKVAKSTNYQLIPTEDENGTPLSKEQFKLIKRECVRLGTKMLYIIPQGKDTLIINPNNLRMGILNDEVH